MADISAYIASFLSSDHPLLEEILQEEQRRQDVYTSVGLEAGRLLSLLVRVARAQRVLEFGTGLGYSTIWLAQAQ